MGGTEFVPHLFAGRFRLGTLLGSGGSASVFEATDVSTGGLVAVKILHPRLSVSPTAREEFLAQARATRGLRHPNIAAVLDLGVAESDEISRAWIALERAPGISLAELVERSGALDLTSAVAVAVGMLRGLEVAHAVGLIHRDISPANVMVDAVDGIAADRITLVDFGLARRTGGDGTGDDGTVLGSVNYLSPEQARGDDVDARGDLYQTAGVLYFAITGEPPFVRSSTEAVLRAHAESPPPVPSATRAGVGRGLDRVVARGLLKDPEARFDSAALMRTELEALGGTSGQVPTRTVRLPLRAATAPSPRTLAGRVASPARPTRRDPLPTAAAAGVEATARSEPGVGTPPAPGNRGGLAAVLGGVLLTAVIVVGWALSSASGSAPPSVPDPSPSVSASPDTVAVASGPPAAAIESVPMPRVDDLTLAAARILVEDAGLTVGTLTIEDSARPADTVLGSSVAAGDSRARGSIIDLRVASGSNRVPATAGSPAAEAIAAVQAAGFAVIVDHIRTYAVSDGAVYRTDPEPETLLRLGSTVTVVVASVPAPTPSASATPTPSASASPSPPPAP